MNCKCPSKTHLEGCPCDDTELMLGDICSICYIMCRNEINSDMDINVEQCTHKKYRTQKSRMLMLIESGEIEILRDNTREKVMGQIKYYCQICKAYIDKPEHDSDDSIKIKECSTVEPRGCNCCITFVFDRDSDKPDKNAKPFTLERICKSQKGKTRNEVLEHIKEKSKEFDEIYMKKMEEDEKIKRAEEDIKLEIAVRVIIKKIEAEVK